MAGYLNSEDATIGRLNNAQQSFKNIAPEPAQVGPVPGPTKPQGPTGFWGRIAQVGIGKVNLLNAYRTVANSGPMVNSNNSIAKNATRDVAHAGAATSRFFVGGTAKLANQGIQEGKQAIDTGRMMVAQSTHNNTAYRNANKQSQQDYKGFTPGKGGILNEGTLTNTAEAKRGDLKTGAQKIGGGTLMSAAELVPFAKLGSTAKVYRAVRGVEAADKAISGTQKVVTVAKDVAKQAAVGGAAGATGTAGSELATNGKLNAKDILIGTAKGAATGAAFSTVGHVVQSAAKGSLKTAITKGPQAALAELKGSKPGMADVMSKDQADHVAQNATMDKTARVTDNSSGATPVTVRQPKLLQKGAIGELPASTKSGKAMNLSKTTTPATSKTLPVSDEEYVQRSTAIAKSHDQQAKAAITDLKKAPAIEGYHTTDELVKDHAAHLQSLDKGLKGGQMQKTTDGGYVRTTEHTPFYSKFYAENGRAPSKAAYTAEAQRQLESGKASHGASDTYNQLKSRETDAVQKVYDAHQTMHDQLDHEYMNGKPNPDYKAATTTDSGFVMGKKAEATATPAATGAQRRISQIDTIIQKAQQKGTTKSASQMRALMKEKQALQDVASGKSQPVKAAPKTASKTSQTERFKTAAKTTTRTSEKAPVKTAHASSSETIAETSAPVKRPTTAAKPVEREPLVNNNKAPAKGTGNLITRAADRFHVGGKLNPVIDAARRGHTAFSDMARSIAGKKVYALRHGNLQADKFDTAYSNYLVHGGTHEQFIHDIETKQGNSEAHQIWRSIHKDTGSQMVEHGVTKAVRDETYVGRVGQFPGKGYVRGGTGLKKSGGFSKGRVQGATDEFGNSSDMFKTHAEYKAHVEANGGKVLSDPRQILRHTLPSKLEAIENSKGLNGLEKTAMADGRPAVISVGSKGAPHDFNDYVQVDGLNGRMVHPDAAPTMKALTHTYSAEELSNPLAKANSMAKKLVTLNGMVHGKNFALASLRKQGAIRTARAIFTSNKDLSARFGEENIQRAVEKGGVVPFEQSQQNLFDKIQSNDVKPSLVQRAFKHGEVPFDAAHSKMNDALFNKLGNHLQLSTYFHAEKQFLKQGMTPDEAAKAAGQAAKNVSFISSSVESSAEYRKTSRLVAFAGQYLKSTMHEAGTAAGLIKDNALSKGAQTAVQKEAIKGMVRGTTYLMGMAQVMNYATTGHSTFQNKGSKISPVFYVDKSTGKEYHISNWYGQIGDVMHMTNPQEWLNKTSPGIQEIARVMSNRDSFTGAQIHDPNASGIRQMGQIVGNTIENLFTPAGFGASNFGKTVGPGADPVQVTLARLMGYGASTQAQNNLEKDISTSYYGSLPQKATSSSPQLSKMESVARHDIANGNTNSPNVQALKGKMSDAAFKSFVKTGGQNQTQYQFDKLSSADKLKIVQKYSPQQLKELDLNGLIKTVGSNTRSQQTLTRKDGYTSQQLQTLLDKARKSQ